jgi:hypothetical protein
MRPDAPIRSEGTSNFQPMNEAHSSEVEKVLLFISDARARARRAADQVRADGADASVVQALEQAERALGDTHRRLAQGTYYAVPDEKIRLAV